MADMIRKSTHTTAEIDAAVDMLLEVYTRDEIDNLLSQKITAIPGKGLSTNDFTNADKSKLDDLENYDDTDIKTEIAKTAEQSALNRSTLGYQRKNLLINNCTTKTENGVTATVNNDGSITLSGISSKSSDFLMFTNMATGAVSNQYANNKKFLPNGNYILSGGSTNVAIQVTVSETNATATNIASSTGKNVKFTIGDSNKYVWFRLSIKANADFGTPVTIYPMIRPAEITDDTYEPYQPSVQEQIDSLTNHVDTEIAKTDEQAALNRSTLGCQRKNLLKNMATSQTINGVTFTVSEDKTVTANGTATANALLIINNNTTKITKNSLFDSIILTGCPNGGGFSKFALGMEFRKNGDIVHTIESYGSVREYKIEDIDHDMCYAYVKIWKNQTVNNLIFEPMLRPAEITDDTYEPYKPSVEERLAALEEKFAALEGGVT